MWCSPARLPPSAKDVLILESMTDNAEAGRAHPSSAQQWLQGESCQQLMKNGLEITGSHCTVRLGHSKA